MSRTKYQYLQLLTDCGGYYECPKDENGNRLGPLVGYAGRDEQDRQFVGDVYYNFARIEEHPGSLKQYAYLVANNLRMSNLLCNYVVSMPLGGLAFGLALASELRARYVFPDFKETEAEGRKIKEFFWGRHEIAPDSEVIITEDVCNNFSSTQQVIDLVTSSGGYILAIACEINRSENVYYQGIPVFSALHLPTIQYQQDDPEVAQDIARGNVIWKPKDEWNKLMLAMQQHQVLD